MCTQQHDPSSRCVYSEEQLFYSSLPGLLVVMMSARTDARGARLLGVPPIDCAVLASMEDQQDTHRAHDALQNYFLTANHLHRSRAIACQNVSKEQHCNAFHPTFEDDAVIEYAG